MLLNIVLLIVVNFPRDLSSAKNLVMMVEAVMRTQATMTHTKVKGQPEKVAEVAMSKTSAFIPFLCQP